MPWIVVDIESDGPCPAIYSMISFGAIVVEPSLSRHFKGMMSPVSPNWNAEALSVCGISREIHETYPSPDDTMRGFKTWLDAVSETEPLTFVSDNPAFDWQFINYYFHRFLGSNPFGFSARRIGDLYSGWKGDARKSNAWKKLRKTKHTHDPLDDAKGNAEALLTMWAEGLVLPFRQSSGAEDHKI